MAVANVKTIRPPATTIGQPERGDSRELPLPAVTVSGEHQVGGMAMVQQLQDVWSMREQDSKAIRSGCRDAPGVCAVKRGVIQAYDAQLAALERHECHLVDEQAEFVAVRQLAKVAYRHAAVMVVISQGEKRRGKALEARQKAKGRNQARCIVEQVAGHEDPIRRQSGDLFENTIMPWEVSFDVQITELDGALSGQWAMVARDLRDPWIVQSEFPSGGKVGNAPINPAADLVDQTEMSSKVPGEGSRAHPITWFIATRSPAVRR